MKSRRALAATLAFSLLGAAAEGNDEFLPVKEAFTYAVEANGDCLTVQWNVAPGYYLYKSRLSMESATAGISLGKAAYPQGEIHTDEFFGSQEIYRDDFTVTAPLTSTNPKAHEILVRLKLQGCADAGFCYPPEVWEAKVRLPES